MSKHQTILDRIRYCGRLGDEEEARRLYIVCSVNFREYCSAYKTGRQEFREMRKEQEGNHG